MDWGEFAFRDGVARGVRKFANETNQHIEALYAANNALYAEADQLARERDTYESELVEAQKQIKDYKQKLAKTREAALTWKENYEERAEACDALFEIIQERDRTIARKNNGWNSALRKLAVAEGSLQRNYVTSSLDSIILKHEDAIKGVLEEMKQKAKQAQKPVTVCPF